MDSWRCQSASCALTSPTIRSIGFWTRWVPPLEQENAANNTEDVVLETERNRKSMKKLILIGTAALALLAMLPLQNTCAFNGANLDPGGGLASSQFTASLENATLDATMISANQITTITAIDCQATTVTAVNENIETALSNTAITVCTENASATATARANNIAMTNPTAWRADGTADFRANPTLANGFSAFEGNATGLEAHDLS